MKIEFVCLLLVLLSATVLSQDAKIKSRYEKFKNQHINKKMNASSCDDVMQARKIFTNTNKCKNTNTFVLSDIKPVKSVCEKEGEPWRKKMTKSLKRFNIVVCKVKNQKAKPPKCTYLGKKLNKKIIIKCEKGFPVHYDSDIDHCENWTAVCYWLLNKVHWKNMFCLLTNLVMMKLLINKGYSVTAIIVN